MSELFGAPSGIIAADKLMADNLRSRNDSQKSQLESQELLGKIAMQPAEQARTAAIARNQNAEAIGREQDALVKDQAARMEAEFARQDPQTQARMQLSQMANSQGKIATVGDLENGKVPAPKSQADYLERFADYAERRGAPPSQVEKTRAEVSKIREREAIAGWRNAESANMAATQQEKLLERVGNIAAAAALSPANYMAIMGSPQGAKLMGQMPLTGNYEADKPNLEAIAQSTQDALKRQKEEREKLNSESRRKLEAAQEGTTKMNAKTAQDREARLDTAAQQAIKNGGANSPEAAEAKRELIAARLATRVAKHLEQYPLAPLDQKSLKPSKYYTLGDGSVGRWEMNPAKGKFEFNIMDQIPKLPMQVKRNKPAATAPAEETADETGD